MPSVLWRCWLGGRKCIWPVKNWVVGCWRGYLSGARCKLAYGPDDATSTHCLLLQYNPDWFTFLVPAHPGIPGQRAIKWVCVCVCGINTIVHLYTAVRLTSVVTHTHTHTFNGPFSGSTWVSRYQKGKPIWILLEQETVSGSGIS